MAACKVFHIATYFLLYTYFSKLQTFTVWHGCQTEWNFHQKLKKCCNAYVANKRSLFNPPISYTAYALRVTGNWSRPNTETNILSYLNLCTISVLWGASANDCTTKSPYPAIWFLVLRMLLHDYYPTDQPCQCFFLLSSLLQDKLQMLFFFSPIIAAPSVCRCLWVSMHVTLCWNKKDVWLLLRRADTNDPTLDKTHFPTCNTKSGCFSCTLWLLSHCGTLIVFTTMCVKPTPYTDSQNKVKKKMKTLPFHYCFKMYLWFLKAEVSRYVTWTKTLYKIRFFNLFLSDCLPDVSHSVVQWVSQTTKHFHEEPKKSKPQLYYSDIKTYKGK